MMAILPLGPGGSVPVGQAGPAQGAGPAQAGGPAKASFVDVVEKLLGDANSGQLQADQAIRELAMGKAENLHDVMLAVAKADLAFRTVLEVRNRLTDAYQEVMRMQV
jgi:flagellar hook-basal body complex protein FliE